MKKYETVKAEILSVTADVIRTSGYDADAKENIVNFDEAWLPRL